MARIVFASTPASGHVRPGLPIARELVARGHEVLWYTGGKFRSSVERTGARHVAFVAGLDFDETDLDGAFPGRSSKRAGISQLKFDLRSVFIDTIPGHMADLRALADREPLDAVVLESAFMAGVCFAEERGLPWAVYGIAPLVASSVDSAPAGLGLPPRAGPLGRLRNRTLNLLVQNVVFAAEQKQVQRVSARLGRPPTREFFMDYAMAHAPVFIQGTIPEFEYPRRDLPDNVRFVGALTPEAPGATSLPRWWAELEEDRPVVLVTQGTVKVDPELLLHPAIEALAGEDVLVVGTTGGSEPQTILGRHDAPNVRLETFIPFADLLPHVDVVVSNGGYGGTQQALSHGIPVVVAGLTEMKNEVAARVAWSGAGIDLKTERPTPDQIRAAVRSLLDESSYRRRARELQRIYGRHDAAGSAADLVEGILRAPHAPDEADAAPQ